MGRYLFIIVGFFLTIELHPLGMGRKVTPKDKGTSYHKDKN